MVYEARKIRPVDLEVTGSVIPAVTSIGTKQSAPGASHRTSPSSKLENNIVVDLGSRPSVQLDRLASGSTAKPLMSLRRKEVIQPHLPIRLPCYDLAPVIGFTFGADLPYGLARRLRVPPTPMA
jgi:hypothetical protein